MVPTKTSTSKVTSKKPERKRVVSKEDLDLSDMKLMWLDKLPSLSAIVEFRDILMKMRSNVSFAEAIKTVSKEKGVNIHTKAYDMKRMLEGMLGMEIFITRPGHQGKRFAPTTGAAFQRLNLLLANFDKILRCFKDIAHANTLADRPEVRIGAIPSIVQYLGAPLLDHVQRKFETMVSKLADESIFKVPHLSMVQGDETELLNGLHSNETEFFLFQSGLRGLKYNGITSKVLPYIPKPFGLVFLKQDRSGKVPFADLCALISKKNLQSAEFQRLVEKHPVFLVQPVRQYHSNSLFQSIHNAFFEGTNAGRGQRIFLPTIRTMRYMVHCGRGIGFGHKPANATFVGKIEDSGVYVGEDPDRPGNQLYFVDLKILDITGTDARWQEPIPFAAYYRAGAMNEPNQGGFSPPVRFVFDCLMDVIHCRTKEKFYLEYEEGKLMHNYHSEATLAPPEFKFNGSDLGFD